MKKQNKPIKANLITLIILGVTCVLLTFAIIKLFDVRQSRNEIQNGFFILENSSLTEGNNQIKAVPKETLSDTQDSENADSADE